MSRRVMPYATLAVLLGGVLSATPGRAQVAMFGGGPSRNMVSEEKGLPAKWNLETGENVQWTAKLGSQTRS
jgi:hypothetical protein